MAPMKVKFNLFGQNLSFGKEVIIMHNYVVYFGKLLNNLGLKGTYTYEDVQCCNPCHVTFFLLSIMAMTHLL